MSAVHDIWILAFERGGTVHRVMVADDKLRVDAAMAILTAHGQVEDADVESWLYKHLNVMRYEKLNART